MSRIKASDEEKTFVGGLYYDGHRCFKAAKHQALLIRETSKYSIIGELAASFPSFVTKIFRIGSTIRADFGLD